MNAKSIALELLAVAVKLLPALGDFLRDAIEALDAFITDANDPRASLANEVRAALPERSETRKALDEAAGKNA